MFGLYKKYPAKAYHNALRDTFLGYEQSLKLHKPQSDAVYLFMIKKESEYTFPFISICAIILLITIFVIN